MNNDFVLPFTLGDGAVKGKFVSLDDSINQILATEKYPSIIARLITELATITAAWGSNLKTDGILTCEIKSEKGIIKALVVDYVYGGTIRGYCNFDHDRLSRFISPSFQDLTTDGLLIVTIDSKAAARYQSVINLNQSTLIDALHKYFESSEQIKVLTKIKIFEEDNGKLCSRGILIEKLPDISTKSEIEVAVEWEKYKHFIETIKNDEWLLSADEVLYRLFHDDEAKIYNEIFISYKCRCSREKMQKALEMLAKQKPDAPKTPEKMIIRCEFCGHTEEFE